MCVVSVCLTEVHLQSIPSATGGYLLAELTVDGTALEAGAAAARLFRHRVLKPLLETLIWCSKEERILVQRYV